MKKTLTKLFAGAAFAAAGVGLVGAGIAVAHPGGPGRAGKIEKFDTNGDGQLSFDEFVAGAGHRHFGKLDK